MDRFEGGSEGGSGGREAGFEGGLVNSLKRHFSKFRCRSISEIHGHTYSWDFVKRQMKVISFADNVLYYRLHEKKLSF